MSISPQYRNCLKVTKLINEKALPALDQAYIGFAKNVKHYVMGRQELHTCRMYTKGAKKSLESGKIDNKNVRKYLEVLRTNNNRLSLRSDALDTLCIDIKSRYKAERKKIQQKNNEHLQNVISGKIPANELLDMLKGLGNRINKLNQEGLQEYQKEVESNVKKTEKDIIDPVMHAYREIVKLDAETFNDLKKEDWTNTDYAGFFRMGAFETQDYTRGIS